MREPMLILHFIGVAMVLGTSLAYLFLGMAANKLDATDRVRFTIQVFPLAKMGHWGLVVMLLSGGYLMTPHWSSLADSPLLISKLVLYLLLGALAGISSGKMRKAKGGDHAQIPAIRTLGGVTLLTGLIIVVLAVLYFG